MDITVKGVHVDTGEALQTYVGDALKDVTSKYFDEAISGDVAFSKDRYNFVSDIRIHVGSGMNIRSQGSATEPYASFDAALERLSTRLRRHKSRIHDRHKTQPSDVGGLIAAKQYVIDAAADHEEEIEGIDPNGQPIIIADMNADIETLTVGEAVMRMDLSESTAIMFRSRKHGGVNMIYRREDGNIGWVDTEIGSK